MREAEETILYLELKRFMEHFKGNEKKVDLVLIAFPYKAGFLYGKIKQLCDMKFGLATSHLSRS